ncbi:hypothetical protein O3G_MSEX005180 [Manduca sexta]|uniref:Peptidase M13 N-terminal domain-containing protein n=1 Tax=Manduca sexta TaxID=7130 RepID=A0A921YY58_MANSE|nr:hypothetical protein O3G_MSEX005180 [Manduca sexta]
MKLIIRFITVSQTARRDVYMSYLCGFRVKTLRHGKKVLNKVFEKISFGVCRKLYRKMKYRVKDPRKIGNHSLEYKLERTVQIQFVLIGVLGLLLLAFAVYTSVLFITDYYRPKICLSEECVGSASRILQSMNRDADPCQDFYEFACGGWIKQNPVPEWSVSWYQLDKARAQLAKVLRELLEEENDDGLPEAVLKAKTFYRTCVDTNKLEEVGIKPLQEVLQKLGLSPSPPVTANANFTWEVTAGRGRRMLGLNVLLNVKVEEGVRNNSRYRILIDQVSPGFNKAFLLKPTWFARELALYHKHVKAMIALIDQKIDAHNFADDVLEFSKKLASIMTSERQRRSGDHLTYDMTIEELQGSRNRPAQWKEHDWEQYLNLVFANTSVTLDPQHDRVIVKDMPYLKRLSVLLNETKPIRIERFLWWNMFSAIAPLTLDAFRQLNFELSKAMYETPQRTPRWKICTTETNYNLGDALSYLYVKRYFDDNSRLKALEMIGDVREAFAETIQKVDWMDASTKFQTLKKLKEIRNLVGFPKWLLTDEQLNKHYQDIEVVEGNLFETYMNLMWITVKKSLELLGEIPDRNAWVSSATTVNAYYWNTRNSICKCDFKSNLFQGLLS